MIETFMQVVYDANKLAKLVKKKKKMQNWLTYYQNRYERNSSKKPEMKVLKDEYDLPLKLYHKYMHKFTTSCFLSYMFMPDWFPWSLGEESGCY